MGDVGSGTNAVVSICNIEAEVRATRSVRRAARALTEYNNVGRQCPATSGLKDRCHIDDENIKHHPVIVIGATFVSTSNGV